MIHSTKKGLVLRQYVIFKVIQVHHLTTNNGHLGDRDDQTTRISSTIPVHGQDFFPSNFKQLDKADII